MSASKNIRDPRNIGRAPGDPAVESWTTPPLPGVPLVEALGWGFLLLVAAVLRLYGLDVRPFHHDESIHASFSYQLATSGTYRYDPVYHGPFQYAMVAGAFRVLGDSDFTARLPAALGGVGLVAMAFLLRPRFGRLAAFLTGVLVASSPNLLYYTRFCREDVWSLLGTAGAFLCLDAWLRKRRLADLVMAALFASVAFTSKENFYVLLALLVPSLCVVFFEPGEVVFWAKVRRLVDFLEENAAAIAGALLVFFLSSELLYTVFLVHPDSGNPAFDAISYWWNQHKVERVGGPKTYYLPRLLQYEFAILLPAALWILASVRTVRSRRAQSFVGWGRPIAFLADLVSAVPIAERFLFAWGVASLAMYAYLGEKTPWLIVHQILPFLPLAGLAFARLFNGGLAFRGLGTAVLGASVATAVSLCFLFPDLTPNRKRAESVIYVQTSPEILKFVADVRAVNSRRTEGLTAVVDGQAAWPLSWYLRHERVAWSFAKEVPPPPLLVVDDSRADEVAEALGPQYVRQEIPLRSWWIPETSWKPLRPTPKELLTYLVTRRPWSEIGAQRVVVFRRTRQNPS